MPVSGAADAAAARAQSMRAAAARMPLTRVRAVLAGQVMTSPFWSNSRDAYGQAMERSANVASAAVPRGSASRTGMAPPGSRRTAVRQPVEARTCSPAVAAANRAQPVASGQKNRQNPTTRRTNAAGAKGPTETPRVQRHPRRRTRGRGPRRRRTSFNCLAASLSSARLDGKHEHTGSVDHVTSAGLRSMRRRIAECPRTAARWGGGTEGRTRKNSPHAPNAQSIRPRTGGSSSASSPAGRSVRRRLARAS